MKRNKLVKFLASGAVFTALIAALTACGGNKNKHSLTAYRGKGSDLHDGRIRSLLYVFALRFDF